MVLLKDHFITLYLTADFIKGAIMQIAIKGTIMQIEEGLRNDRLNVSKVYWKFRIPTVYNFAVIYSWNLPFS